MANITKTLRKESKHDSSPIITALGKGIYKAVTVVTNPTTKEVYIDPTGRGRLAAYIPVLGGDPSKPMYFRHASNTGSFGAPVKDGEVIGFLGVKVPVIPGARAKMAVPELESGRYALICFLPDTSVPGEEQPPHFVLGMVSEFEVE